MLRMAEPPYMATSDDRHEWSYGQHKHREAVGCAKGLVDQSVPKCVNPAVQDVQAYTRRFREDQRRAEIGRENLKLVKRLRSISANNQHSDPRAPPPAKPPSADPGSPGANMHGPAVTTNIKGEKLRSLNETGRRVMQRQIDQENSALVRRILSIKTTFDANGQKRSFEKHQSASFLLQRLPDVKRKPKLSRSLPAIRPLRSASALTLPPKGLEALFLPGELIRSASSSAIAHSATAPVPAVTNGEDSSQGAPDRAAWPQPKDEATERRCWTSEDERGQAENQAEKEFSASDSQPQSSKQLTGMSVDSDVQFADDWDDYSMTSTGSAAGTHPRGLLASRGNATRGYSTDSFASMSETGASFMQTGGS